jgi:hypothetical protein
VSGLAVTDLLGGTILQFAAITGVIMGFAAYMTGYALASTWKPLWQVGIYCALLAAGARFLMFALGDGRLFSLLGYLASVLVLEAIGIAGWQLNRARKMVTQYPWLYERAGPFGWRPRRGPEHNA